MDGAAEEKMNKAVAEYEKNVWDGSVEEINKAMEELEKTVGDLAKAADEWEKASVVKKWTEPESER
jgi:tetrahydromethanopterin S-methyltransferase subunit B